MFYNKVTTEMLDYASLKVRYPLAYFPAEESHSGVDERIDDSDPLGLTVTYADIIDWERLYVIEAPTGEIYQVVEPADPRVALNPSNSRYETQWSVRNMTQPELDALNQSRQDAINAARGAAYVAQSDPLFFKSEREETTKDEWRDKVQEIRTMFPEPELITIPE